LCHLDTVLICRSVPEERSYILVPLLDLPSVTFPTLSVPKVSFMPSSSRTDQDEILLVWPRSEPTLSLS
jgi:hypothetical protein